MTDYMLTAAAEADMRGIIRYTRKQWGDVQVHEALLASRPAKGLSGT